MKSIGKNIRTLRTQKNITQEALAEALFVTRQTVSNYETGRSQPDVEMLLKIADVLGVDANALIYGPPKPPAAQNRRAAYIRMAVGGGLLAALCIVALAAGLPQFPYNGWAKPGYACHDLRHALLYPLLLTVAGWCVVQALSLLLKFDPPKWKYSGVVGWVLFALFAFVLLTLVQYRLAGEFQDTIISDIFYSGWNELYGVLANVAYPSPWAFFPVGTALWLFGFPRRVRQRPPAAVVPTPATETNGSAAKLDPAPEQQKTEP